MEYKNKPIWLLQGEHQNIIVKCRINVTNPSLYSEMVKKLRDINSYVQTSSELKPGSSEDYTVHSINGAVVYEHYYPTKEYNCSHFETHYVNPRREVFSLLTGDEYYPWSDLTRLFATLDKGGKEEVLLKEFECAKEIIMQMENGTIDIETFKQKINQMWPNFGFYVCECLNCTDIAIESSYDIDEIRELARRCEELNFEVPREIREILSNESLAKRNTKVLSLAKSTHKILCDKR